MDIRQRRNTNFTSLLSGGFSQIARADLTLVSSETINGFPQFYRDLPKNDPAGTTLQLCLDPALCPISRMVEGNSQSRLTGFGPSAFYWEAHTKIFKGEILVADIHMGLEATYDGGLVEAGKEIINNFLRISVKNLPVDGTYMIVHPYGHAVFNVVADPASGKREASLKNVSGGANFSLALNGPVGPFLKGVAPASPPGFIGNSNIPQKITGSPNGTNFFQILGPANADLGGPLATPNLVRQNLFFVSGKLL